MNSCSSSLSRFSRHDRELYRPRLARRNRCSGSRSANVGGRLCHHAHEGKSIRSHHARRADPGVEPCPSRRICMESYGRSNACRHACYCHWSNGSRVRAIDCWRVCGKHFLGNGFCAARLVHCSRDVYSFSACRCCPTSRPCRAAMQPFMQRPATRNSAGVIAWAVRRKALVACIVAGIFFASVPGLSVERYAFGHSHPFCGGILGKTQ